MTRGVFQPAENKRIDSKLADARYEIKPGDLLVSRANTTAYVGASVLVGACRPKLLLSDKSLRLVAREGVDRRWLQFMLSSPQVRDAISAKASGTKDSMRNISQAALLDVDMPKHSSSEQRRIVTILEDHLSRLDAAESYVSTSLRRLESLSVSVILSDEIVSQAPNVPLLQVLADPLANGRSVPSQDGGFPVLRLTALKATGLDLAERKGGAWNAQEAAPFLVRRGDYYVSRGNGSIKLVARGALLRAAPDAVAFPDTMVRLRVDEALINPEYLDLIWNSPLVRRQVEAGARTTAGIYKVNQRQLESVLLPVPGLADQRRVLARRDATSPGVAALRRAAAHQGARSADLRRALLAAAFTGRLAGRSTDLDLAEKLAIASAPE